MAADAPQLFLIDGNSLAYRAFFDYRNTKDIYGKITDRMVLDEVGVAIPDEQEDEVEKFREFLDNVSPDDFAADG